MRFQLALLLLLLIAAGPTGDGSPYSNDFTQAADGKLPEAELLALSGEFEVKEVDGNRVLELSPVPLESLGGLFGPTLEQPAGSAAARIWGSATGQRFPEFGVGMNDAGGYKLWLIPRQKLVVLRKAEETVAKAPYESWASATWTHLKLEVASTGKETWTVKGKVWPDNATEPAGWTLTFEATEEPASGRASIWANPYSGTPIRFDDLMVRQ